MVIKVVGCDELNVSAPAVAVEEVPVTCGNADAIDFAIEPSADTPFWREVKISVKELGITFSRSEPNDTVSAPGGRIHYLPL